MNKIEAETRDINEELEKKREELFLTENKVIFKQNQVEKTKNEIENVNIVQELERDVYIPEFEKGNMIFNNENNKQQEALTRIAKELNSEKLKKSELYKQCSMLKKQLKTTYNKGNYTNKNMKNDIKPSNKNFKQKGDATYNNSVKPNENDLSGDSHLKLSLTEQAKELENTSFYKFFEEQSIDRDETLIFTDKVNMIVPSKEVMSNIKLQIQLPNQATNQTIPKLDLKQIEFNKSKVKGKFISISSNNINQIEEINNVKDDINNYNNKHNDNLSNSKNKNTKTNTDSGTQKENKIEQMRQDINVIKDKIRKNKRKVTKFKKFYKELMKKYNSVLIKYDLENSTSIMKN